MTLTGQTIRGYQLGDRIGSGGYGEVYRATQMSVDREVAIKVILPQFANDPKFVTAFEAEAQLVAQLEHTNIVPLHDYWQDNSGAFLVMRYVRGGSLKDMIERHGALPLTRTVRLIEQVADALQVAHDADVVHRDLKPANILIDQRGSAYLTDFGIAKRLTSDSNSDRSGAVKGTFAYMAPEQIYETAVSPQTDIYALGVMLYEMLAGQHPFHEASIGALLLKHMQERLRDIHDIRDDLPPVIGDVIQKATEKDPSDRYSSVLELVNDLKNGVSGASVLQPTTLVKQKPATTEDRNRDAMLTNVYKFWVEGVLKNSLHNAVMIDLGLKPESGAVDNPWDMLIRTPSGNETLNDERIIDVFDRLNGKLLILGDPGSGKTITLLTLARDLLLRAEADTAHPIPVVLNLSSWSENQPPLTEWLVEELNTKYQVPRKVAMKWVEGDELLLLLDGLDEVALEWRDPCVNAINTYRSEHGFVDVVVCSRIADYEVLDAQLLMNGAVVIQPLDRAQIKAYFDVLGPQLAPIVALLDKDEALYELCQSPFMLSIIALTYADQSWILYTASDSDVETMRQRMFTTYVDWQLDRAQRRTSYSRTQILQQLHWLSRRMQDHNQSIFRIEELQPTWLGEEGARLFATAYSALCMLLGALLWVATTPLMGNAPFWERVILPLLVSGLHGVVMWWGFTNTRVPYDRWWIAVIFGLPSLLPTLIVSQELSGSVFNVVIFAVLYRVMAYVLRSLNYRPDTIHVVERLQFSIQQVRWSSALLGGLAIGGFAIFSLAPFVFPGRLPLAAAVGFMISSIAVGLTTGLTGTNINANMRINQGIYNSARNALMVGLGNAIGVFLVFVTVNLILNGSVALGVYLGLYIAVFFFVLIAFVVGFAPVIQHLVLRVLMHRQWNVPWNYAAFLEHVARMALLKRVGGGYIFIHRYLLEYFATLEPNPPEK